MTANDASAGAPVRGGLELRDPQAGIKAAALKLFWRYGYEGTSVRAIAEEAGLSVAGIYYHYPSKLDVLFELMDETMTDLIVSTESHLGEGSDDPIDKLYRVVWAHVRFHTRRQRESFVGNTELRSLSHALRKAIIAKRDHQQHIFDSIVLDGVARGVFHTPEPAECSRAIVTMCTAVATWHKSSGELSGEAIARRYARIALAAVEAEPWARDHQPDEGAAQASATQKKRAKVRAGKRTSKTAAKKERV